MTRAVISTNYYFLLETSREIIKRQRNFLCSWRWRGAIGLEFLSVKLLYWRNGETKQPIAFGLTTQLVETLAVGDSKINEHFLAFQTLSLS